MSTELNPSDRPDISSDRAGLSRLSSAMDGDLWPGVVDEVLAVWRQDAGSRVAWHDYHLIGDVLRSEDLAAAPAGDELFLQALRGRLAREPVPIKPVRQVALRSVSWWRKPAAIGAGFASIAGLLVVYRLLVIDPGAQASGSQLARRVQAGELVRNARLDRYLEAHRTMANGVMTAGGAQFRVHTVSDIQ